MVNEPLVGLSSPARMRNNVLLPQPLLPMTATNCPWHVEVDAVEHGLVAEAFADALKREGERRGRRMLWQGCGAASLWRIDALALLLVFWVKGDDGHLIVPL